jgi:hypothetical protein
MSSKTARGSAGIVDAGGPTITWPDWLRLEGSHYDAINADPGNDSARRRLDWLKLQQDGYTPRRMSSSPPSIGVPGTSEAPVL